MPCPSLLPSHPVHSFDDVDDADDWFASLDGSDLAESLAVAREIIAAGAWRSWMVKRFMRLHRHEVTRLMRQLGPLIPPRRAHLR